MSRERLSRAAAQQLIQGARRDADASKVALCDVYELPDGRVLLMYGDGPAFIDDSYDELVRWIAANAHRSGKVSDVFLRLLPQQENFIEAVDALIANLAARLNVPLAQLDFSADNLHAIDRALKKVPRSQFSEPTLFAPVVAYLGEFIRRSVHGTWQMERGAGGVLPTIVDPRGHVYLPTRIYKEFIDSGHIPSLASFVAKTIPPIKGAPQ